MKIRRLLMSALLPMTCLCAAAQQGEDNTPAKGDFTVAATLGYNSYTEATALPGNLTDYEASAFATDWSKKKLTVGFEAGYFVSEKWKLSLGGGINFTHNPGYADKPGTMTLGMSGEDMVGEIPSYRAVASQYSCTYNVAAGLDRYFSSSVKNLMWYGGVRVGMAYSLNEQKYDEWTAMGKSVGESWSLRGALTIGADYYVMKGMYVGASVDPFAYTYNMTSFRPQEGLARLSADSSNFAILAAPTVKIGFRF
ncbi:BT1926 family outer membrane beta-barrel protein [Paramuribaculum intestinale]|uniref:BT1926 family outer membrane beta-barrel protein n=1 Tax=Paramuribaculum intestinale TaxID=2094151 RepID=UPI0025B659FE|nr:BT1926 family outer membrane beta-barrel protein [Paramuribaculum intestinale]